MGKFRFFLEPRSIAVIGASAVEGKVGHAVVRNIKNSGYKGQVYPINPKPGSILGYDSYKSVEDVLDEIDIAVICIPARLIPSAAEECGKKGVKGIIVVAAGFREVGGAGAELEQKLVDICRQYQIRLVGPNSLGNITLTANMSFSHKTPRRGKIAMLSQSGAMMTAILDWADTHDIGFSHFISLGNKADMDEVDFIDEISDDPNTTSLILYLESVNDGEKFMRVVSAATRKKPVIILKSGKSAAGQAAASSHTGALAGDDLAFDLAFERAGVIRASTMNELFDLARFFDKVSRPLGDNFVIVTNAGGPGIIATDECARNGVKFAVFSDETNEKLRAVLPHEASIRNPIDIVGDAPPQRYHDTLAAIFAEPPEVVAGALILVTPQSQTRPNEVAQVLVETKAEFPERLIVATFMGGSTMNPPKALLEKHHIPCYAFPEPMIRCIKEIVRYRHLIDSPELGTAQIFGNPDSCGKDGNFGNFQNFGKDGSVGNPEDLGKDGFKNAFDDTKVSQIIAMALADERQLLNPIECADILEIYGIDHPRAMLARSPEEAARMAAELGFPVVMKIVSPQILHKSDCNGVRTRILDAAMAAEMYKSIMEDAAKLGPQGAKLYGVEIQGLVDILKYQKMTEVILGMRRDPQWGPMLMVGMGGIYANIMKDISFRLIREGAYTEEMALDHLKETKVYKILEGVRGQPRSDIEGLLHVMTRIAQLVQRHPEIAELDLNPLLIFEKQEDKPGVFAIDFKVILK